jgi:hypothetical protein
MRRYLITFCIFLILSIFHFALAAPVAVGEIFAVRSSAVDVLKDGIATWEKRMDSGDDYDKDHWSTNEAYRKPEGNKPGSDANLDDEPGGYNKEDMLGSKSPQVSEKTESDWGFGSEMESDARGPDRYYNSPPDEDFFDSAEDVFYYDSEDDLYHDEDDGNGNGGDNDNGGYDGDDEHSDDTVRSGGQGSVENTSLGPKSEHPTAPEHTTNLEKISKGSLRLGPRNSGTGAVGTPKRESQPCREPLSRAYVSDFFLPL